MLAALSNCAVTVRYLAEQGADVEAKDQVRYPLHLPSVTVHTIRSVDVCPLRCGVSAEGWNRRYSDCVA